jgi:hypothetical protein
MQPTIHLEGKAEYLPCTNPAYIPNVLWVAFFMLLRKHVCTFVVSFSKFILMSN